MKVAEITELINEKISLRKPNPAKIAEYTERMLAGAIFPSVIIGRWPKSEKYGDTGIVDGLHRLAAAHAAKLDSLPTETREFESLEAALLYMYEANMAHGLPVNEEQRNSRIKLIRQIDPKSTLDKIAKQFGLSTASVDRIVKGQQGEGKSGPKGANASKGHKSQQPLKGKAFVSLMQRLDFTFKKARPVIELIDYLNPEGEEGNVLNVDAVKTIKAVKSHLDSLIKELR